MKESERLVILGARSQGAETREIADAIMKKGRNLIVIGFIDDHTTSSKVGGLPILGGREDAREILEKFPETKMIAAIGNPRVRMKAVNNYKKLGFQFMNLIHPSSQLSESVELGTGELARPVTPFLSLYYQQSPLISSRYADIQNKKID